MSSLPHVVVLGTGGTITGVAAATDVQGYQAGVLSIADVLSDIPELADVAKVSSEQLFNVDSVEVDVPQLLLIARSVDAHLSRDDVDAVVITHGTDTLEETAFFLNLVVPSAKPIVVVGAMRPADARSADGPKNLIDAIAVAASPAAHGQGVLVVFGEEVFSGRDVMKQHVAHTGAFGSPFGALGEVVGTTPRFYRAVTRRHDVTSAFSIRDIVGDSLPAVEVVYSHADMPLSILDAVVESGARGLVHVGPGGGNIPTRVIDWLDDARTRGLAIVRAARVPGGVISRNGVLPDDVHGWVAADDLTPAKARLLLALALTKTADVDEIQALVWGH